MKNILLLGAGRSATVLIEYLLNTCIEKGWKLRAGDFSEELARSKIKNSPNSEAFRFDLFNEEQRKKEINGADIVISMMPPHLHYLVARDCIQLGKNMTSASYVSDEIRSLHDLAVENNVLILKECGLDPGLDHMSATATMNRIKKRGKLLAFETFTGGLLAPSKDDNPWQYKFTWNPRNVVLAGQGGVKFLQEGMYKYIPYHRVFRRMEVIHIPGHGYFEGYPNRDSLKYLKIYDLEGIRTLFRGTLRKPGFCNGWDIFIQLGATDDSYEMEGVDKMTHRDFINSFLPYNPHDSVELKLAHYVNIGMESQEMYLMKWMGVFENEKVGLTKGTPAKILEAILTKKWAMTKDERDMIVMLHKFNFEEADETKQILSYMIIEGDDANNTAMAKTVGLPLGIVTKLVLEGKINLRGVQVPIDASIYEPVLAELRQHGITFKEEEKVITNTGSKV